LRFVMLFSLAAISIARAAACSDFNILANGKSINALPGNSVVNDSIMIGEDLEYTVSPIGDVILWTRLGVTLTAVPAYSPPITIAATGNVAQNMVINVKNCGVEKTINLKLLVRPYTVTFDPTGGEPTPQQQKVNPGNYATKPTTDPTKTGYTFYRWEMPVGTAYSFSTPVTDSITLKAAWTPKDYKISFDTQGGPSIPTKIDVTYSKRVGPLPTPANRTGYEFSGWYSAASGGTKYTEETIYQTADNITLYARWTAKKYKLIFSVNSSDGRVSPADKQVTYDAPVGTLPTPTRAAFEFKGWYLTQACDGAEYKTTTIYQTDGETIIYAKWEFIKGTRPKIEMLNYSIPTGLVYKGAQITSLPTASQKLETYGRFGAITILYNGEATPPKNAGVYAISAYIAQDPSEDYDTATVSLGSMTIARAAATSSIISVTAKNKEYDAKTTAEIEDVNFNISPLYPGDIPSTSDYSVIANFATPNVGTGIAVSGTISWRANGPLSKNYSITPSPLTFTTTANITQATATLEIIDSLFAKEPPFYKYTEPVPPAAIKVSKSSFIPDGAITFKYKRDGESDDAYTELPPNRVGWWYIKATLPETPNYTSAWDLKYFRVIRGNEKPVKDSIAFLSSSSSNSSFTRDSVLSNDPSRAYYVANECEIKNTTIRITIIGEPDIVLKLKYDSPHPNESVAGQYYDIPFEFDKPGLYPLIYTLRSTDPDQIYLYEEEDTLLIETPIPFDGKIVKQKWNNTMFINNNPKSNGEDGGYEFTDFKWFKNDTLVSDLQFYSAGPKSTDTLKTSDIYKVTMHTKDGARISTCKGNPKTIPLAATEKPAVTKQVLGINGKKAKPEQKVYDIYGAQRKDTPAGVYIIEDK